MTDYRQHLNDDLSFLKDAKNVLRDLYNFENSFGDFNSNIAELLTKTQKRMDEILRELKEVEKWKLKE